MSLSFKSISHGQIAFGFFNIESDMLLLEQYFMFGQDFSHEIVDLASSTKEDYCKFWEVYEISPRQAIGDLMAAIQGVKFEGFIGEVYKHFPFPSDPDRFKQNPEGYKTRSIMEEIINRYGHSTKIPVSVSTHSRQVWIGEYRFSKEWFQELLKYVWQGGYPRWKDGMRPDYLLAMAQEIGQSSHPILEGLVLNN